jgi:hypothetical protein
LRPYYPPDARTVRPISSHEFFGIDQGAAVHAFVDLLNDELSRRNRSGKSQRVDVMSDMTYS